MDNEPQQLSKEQQEELNATIERGVAFEELVRTKGWEYIKSYYELKLKAFVSTIFTDAAKPLADFETSRHELLGLKDLLSEVEWSIKTLEEQRKKKNEQPT